MANEETVERKFEELDEKAAPVEADGLTLADSEDSGNPKRLLLSRLKALVLAGFTGGRVTVDRAPSDGGDISASRLKFSGAGGADVRVLAEDAAQTAHVEITAPSGGGGISLPSGANQDDVLTVNGGAVDATKLGDDNIAPGGVGTQSLAAGGVTEPKLAEAVSDRLLPDATGAAGRELRTDGRGDWEIHTPAPPAGANSGLDEAQVDARVEVGVKPFARSGSAATPSPDDLAPNSADGQELIRSGAAAKWVDRRAAPASWAAAGNTDPVPDAKLEERAPEGTFITQAQPNEDTTTFHSDSSESTATLYFGRITEGGDLGTRIIAGGEELDFGNLPANRDVNVFVDARIRVEARLNGTVRLKLAFVDTRSGAATILYNDTITGNNAAQYAVHDLVAENVRAAIRGDDGRGEANRYSLDLRISDLTAGTAYFRLRAAAFSSDNGITISHALGQIGGVKPAAIAGTGARWTLADFAASVLARMFPAGGAVGNIVRKAAGGLGWSAFTLAALDDTDVVLAGNGGKQLEVNAEGTRVVLAEKSGVVRDVSALPAAPSEDEEVDLTVRSSIEDFGVFTFAADNSRQILAGWGGPLGAVDREPRWVQDVLLYGATGDALANRLTVWPNPATMPQGGPTRIRLRNLTDGGAWSAWHNVADSPAPFNGTYRTAANAVAALDTTKQWAVQIEFGAANKVYPDRTLGPLAAGDPPKRYQFHDFRWWEIPPPDMHAGTGNFERLTALLAQGLAITHFGQTENAAALTLLDPVVLTGADSDDDLLAYEVVWRRVPNVGNISAYRFTGLGYAPDALARDSGSVTLADIRAAAAFAVGGSNGVLLSSVQIGAGANTGWMLLRAARDSQGRVGVYSQYLEVSGDSSKNGSIQFDLRIARISRQS